VRLRNNSSISLTLPQEKCLLEVGVTEGGGVVGAQSNCNIAFSWRARAPIDVAEVPRFSPSNLTMGIIFSLLGEVICLAALCVTGLRVLAGITITDLQNWYLARAQRAKEDSALSVGLISKFLYPLLLRENIQLKSEPYRTESTNTLVRDEYKWLENKGNTARRRWLLEQQKCTQRIMQQTIDNGNESFQTYMQNVKACDEINNIDLIYERGSKVFFWKRGTGHAMTCSSHFYVADSITADTLGRATGQATAAARPQRPNAPKENCRELLSLEDLAKSAKSANVKGSAAAAERQDVLIGTWVCGEGNTAAYAFTSSGGGAGVGIASGNISTTTTTTLKVRDVASGADLPDVLSGLHASSLSVAWQGGNTGFFYTRLVDDEGGKEEERNIHLNGLACVYFHALGTSQDKDVKVLSAPVPDDEQKREFYTVQMSVDTRFLMISVSEEEPADVMPSLCTDAASSNRPNRLFYLDVSQGKYETGTVRKLIDGSLGASCWEYIGNTKLDFYFRTNHKAPKFRVVRIQFPENASLAELDVNEGGPNAQSLLQESCLGAEEWVPQNTRVLESANIAAKSVLVLKYRCRQFHEVLIHDLEHPVQPGEDERAVELPKAQCDGIEGPWCDYYSSSIFYRTSNFANPGCIWRAKVARSEDASGEIFITSIEPLFEPEVPNFNMFDYETVEEMILSKESGSSGKLMKGGSQANAIPEGTGRESTASDTSGSSLRNAAGVHVLLFRARHDDHDESRLPKPEGRARRLSGVGPSSTTKDLIPGTGSPFGSASAKPARSCVLCVSGGIGMDHSPSFSAALALYAKHFGASICFLRVDLSAGLVRAIDCVLEAAVYLVDTGVVTSPKSLGLYGGTTGALLCAAALNARPDLFCAAVLQDGIYDLMRVHRLNPPMSWCGESAQEAVPIVVNTEDASQAAPINPALSSWGAVLGNGESETILEACTSTLQISPFHNIKTYWVRDDELCYPAVLVRAQAESVVNVAHSFKYTAELQRVWGANDRAVQPLLLDFECENSELSSSPQSGQGPKQGSAPASVSAASTATSARTFTTDAQALLFIARHSVGAASR